ncbi:MAG: hypothetical protein NVSMB27_13300 [Ktedonobacteraceae bacterium]
MQHSFLFSFSRFLPQLVVGILIIAVLFAGACCSGSLIAHATGGEPNFGLQPVLYDPSQPDTQSYFIFDAHPGTVLHNRVRVTNSGTATGTVNLYAVDATTGQTSGVVYLSHNDSRRDVGAWLTLGMQHLTLAPGQSQIVSFAVAIPKTVRPGQHVGGIVAENVTPESSSQSGMFQIHVRNLTIVAVQVNLPGPQIEQLVVTGIQPGGANNYQTLLVGLHNTGTVMLKPSGTLQITNAQGHLLKSLPLKLDTFLPQTAISYPTYVQRQAFGAGVYRAVLTLRYGHNQVLHYTTTFTITQRQLMQIFKSNLPLQPPGMGGNPSALPLWQIVLGGLLLVSSVLYWKQKLYPLAMALRVRGRSTKIK